MRRGEARAVPFCSQCGHSNPEGSRFCSQCGARLQPSGDRGDGAATTTMSLTGIEAAVAEDTASDLSTADQAAVEALPAGSALLVVRRGPNAGSRFLLDTDLTTAGRHPDADIFLDDVTVSRRHAEFRRTAEGFTVRDVGSLNGTYVNRDRIDDALLNNGDEVQIGKYRLLFFAAVGGEGRKG